MSEPDDSGSLLEAGFRYALSLTHDVPEAEEILQDGWVSLLQAGGARTRGYLFRAIRSRFIDRFRRRQLALVETLPAEDLEAAAVDDVSARSIVVLADADKLRAALAELRVEEREAVFLQVVEGYSAAEIAALTEAPRGSVLSRIHRAKQKLAAALTRQRVRK